MNYDLFYQNKGGSPSKVESWSHFNDPIPKDGQPHGNSRRHGDAPLEVQAQVIDTIVAECHKRGFTREDTAHVLAIARIESGFNPDAAAGESSASGVGQFIAKTGAAYGINDSNRFNLADNVKALVDHFEDNKNLAYAKGKDAAFVYKYHHDGPVNNSGGLSLAKSDVLPHARSYLDSDVLKDFKSTGPAALGTGARVDSEFKHARNAHLEGVGTHVSAPKHSEQPRSPGFDFEGFRSSFQKQLKEVMPPGAEGHGRSANQAVPKTHASGFDVDAFRSSVQKQLKEMMPHGAEGRAQAADRVVPQPHVTDINSAGARAEASVISLSLALREHLIEKGFDADTVSKAPSLADTVRAMDSREAAGSFLVVHKEGGDVASLVPKADHVIGLHQGDSLLLPDRLKALSSSGLDVDAVAALRGLAPGKTQPHSDLEVYQAAPAELYQRAVNSSVPLQSTKDSQDLVQGLSAQEKLQTPQPEQRASAAAKETSASAEMTMGS